MASRRRLSPLKRWILGSVLAVILVIGAYGGYLAVQLGQEGLLPWQPDPTRPVVTPFAGLSQPMGGDDATPAATP